MTDGQTETDGADSDLDSLASAAIEPSALDVQIGLLEQHQLPATDFVL
jgi:hypothetical protein